MSYKSYYNSPIPGRAIDLKTRKWVDLSLKDLKSFKFKKTTYLWGGKEYAIFENGIQEIAQTLQTLRFVRCKPGEDNIASKLSNKQGIEIYERAISEKETQSEIAKDFGVTEQYVSKIKNLRARTQITRNYIKGVEPSNPAKQAKRDKNKRLSAKIAEFIRKDKIVMKLTTSALAKKYCVTRSTINKILANKMYKAEKSDV
jgi:transcriptional regulator with XRE-family HTH domain